MKSSDLLTNIVIITLLSSFHKQENRGLENLSNLLSITVNGEAEL